MNGRVVFVHSVFCSTGFLGRGWCSGCFMHGPRTARYTSSFLTSEHSCGIVCFLLPEGFCCADCLGVTEHGHETRPSLGVSLGPLLVRFGLVGASQVPLRDLLPDRVFCSTAERVVVRPRGPERFLFRPPQGLCSTRSGAPGRNSILGSPPGRGGRPRSLGGGARASHM